MVIFVVFVLGYGAGLVYTVVTHRGPPWWFLVLGLVGLAVIGVALSSRLARAASFDGRTLRVSTLRGERAIDVEEIDLVGWYGRGIGLGAFTTVQTRQGSVAVPSSPGADLLRRLKQATRDRPDRPPG